MERLHSAWNSDFVWSFRHSPVAVLSLAVVILLVLAAVFGLITFIEDLDKTRRKKWGVRSSVRQKQ